MKKYIKLSATAALGLFLVACGNTSEEPAESTQESVETVSMVETSSESVDISQEEMSSDLSLPTGSVNRDERTDDRKEDSVTFKFFYDGEEEKSMKVSVDYEKGMTVYEAMHEAQKEAQKGQGRRTDDSSNEESSDDLGIRSLGADESSDGLGLDEDTEINDPDAFHFYMDEEGVVWSIYDIDNDWETGDSWVYLVNGEFAESGVQSQKLKAGDVVEWHYGDPDLIMQEHMTELTSEEDFFGEDEPYLDEINTYEEEYPEDDADQDTDTEVYQ